MIHLLLLGVFNMGFVTEMPRGFRVGRDLAIKPVQRRPHGTFDLGLESLQGLQVLFAHAHKLELFHDFACVGAVLMHVYFLNLRREGSRAIRDCPGLQNGVVRLASTLKWRA